MIIINEIVERGNTQLPDTLEDLTQFVLVGKAKLQAYMLKLQTVNKLSVAQEIRDQTLKEAQEVSNALIAAEQRIGELLLAIPKSSGGDRKSEDFKNRDGSNFEKTKSETIKEMGYSKDEASDYQKMAKNPEIVQKVIEDAIANGEIVTKASVMREIKFYKDRISSLEKNSEPQVITKEVRIEVVPDDYEDLKKRDESRLKDYRALEKIRDQFRDENTALKARVKELEERKDIKDLRRKLEEETGYFVIQTLEYIRRSGGYIWITEYIDQLPEKQKKEFCDAVFAIDAFGKQMVENIGGYSVGRK